MHNENDELLKNLLDIRYFNVFKEDINSPSKQISNLELYITSSCNLKCSYCYLNKYEHQLYPSGSTNFSQITKNLEILFDHFLEENYSIDHIDLFSGEVWGTEVGNKVLDIILNAIRKGFKVNTIMVPTNCTFILDAKKVTMIENYIEEYRKLNVKLSISASIDGKLLEDTTRPFKGDNGVRYRDDKFYDDVFTFCRKHNFLFHPMIAAYGIEKWKDNYEWYKDMVLKYNFPLKEDSIMMLEVRNDDWTDAAIEEFIKFIDFLIEDKIKDLGGVKAFTDYLFNVSDDQVVGYLPYTIPVVSHIMPCTIQNQLAIRLGDLSFVPCHRMAYDQFVFGNYEVENDKITGIKANNPELAIKVMFSNPNNSIHGCDNCSIKNICMKGCFGAQYEYGEEPFMPLPSVCKLFKRKYMFLLNKYKEIGVFDIALKYAKEDIRYSHFLEWIEVYENILQGENECMN